MTDRMRARDLAVEFLARNKPLEWFDVLYQEAKGDCSQIPWADFGRCFSGCEPAQLPFDESIQ